MEIGRDIRRIAIWKWWVGVGFVWWFLTSKVEQGR